jgi:hypothetical protein
VVQLIDEQSLSIDHEEHDVHRLERPGEREGVGTDPSLTFSILRENLKDKGLRVLFYLAMIFAYEADRPAIFRQFYS